MKVVLELLGQTSNVRRVTVRHDIVIGRSSECNLRVSAPQVSRRHCFLTVSDEGVTITDLDSCNGTWIDGQKTVPGKRYPITDGSTLTIGPVRFTARLDDPVHIVEDVEVIQPEFDSTVSPDLMQAGSMDFSSGDEPTRDYGSGNYGELRPDETGVEIVAGCNSDEGVIVDEVEVLDDDAVPAQSVEVIELEEDFSSHGEVDEIIVLDDDDEETTVSHSQELRNFLNPE